MKPFIPSLTGLRAICICIVIASHLYINGFIQKTFLSRTIALIFMNGAFGVGVFFVISGFLITGLLIKEKERTGFISLKAFYMRRSLRIFPAYYFLLIVYAILQYVGYIHLEPINWISDITYTKQFFPTGVWEDGHFWSSSVEEVFYLLWPIAFTKIFSNRTTLPLCFIIALFPFVRLFTYGYPTPHISTNILNTGDSMLIGCLFAIKYEQIKNWVVAHKKVTAFAFVLLPASIYSFSYAFHLVMPQEHSFKQNILLKFVLPLLWAFFGSTGTFTNILIGIIILYSINVQSLWFKFLNFKPIVWLGLLSYSLYLWQQIFVSKKFLTYQINTWFWIVLILFCACLSYYFIEKPFLTLKNKFQRINSKENALNIPKTTSTNPSSIIIDNPF